jgi:hypothetical protein
MKLSRSSNTIEASPVQDVFVSEPAVVSMGLTKLSATQDIFNNQTSECVLTTVNIFELYVYVAQLVGITIAEPSVINV